jgi:carboxylesterase type B
MFLQQVLEYDCQILDRNFREYVKMFQYMSDTTFTRAVIKHASIQSGYSDVYFYQFSYDGKIGNVSVIVEGNMNRCGFD